MPPNPYLIEATQEWARSDFSRLFHMRDQLVRKYAWAVPSQEALNAIASLGPIVEIGAGSGYWAHLLREMGVDVVAYDSAPPGSMPNHYHDPITIDQVVTPLGGSCWTSVLPGSPEVLSSHPDRALLLCWPPLGDSMATECLDHFIGERLVYIGEGPGGCTANDAFHDRLRLDFVEQSRVILPQWPGIHDELMVWTRRGK